MQYKHIYSEVKQLKTEVHYEAQCVDAFYPDYVSDSVPQGAPVLIRLAHQVDNKLIDIYWQMLVVRGQSEAQVIREAIRLFDEQNKLKALI